MDLNEYQREAVKTAVFPRENGVFYCSLKLCGEAGEHAEKVGKLFLRGDFDEATKDDIDAAKHAIVQELGDCLWYIANLAELYGYTLEEIGAMNIIKLRDRQQRGVLKGSGDQR